MGIKEKNHAQKMKFRKASQDRRLQGFRGFGVSMLELHTYAFLFSDKVLIVKLQLDDERVDVELRE